MSIPDFVMIPEKLQDLIETLSLIEDRNERIQYLISLSESFRPPPTEIASKPYPEERRVPGCESAAFEFSALRADGTKDFYFAVENPQGVSAMALAEILHETLSGARAEEIAQVPEDVIYEIFGNELSMGKSMGLMGMVRMLKADSARMQP